MGKSRDLPRHAWCKRLDRPATRIMVVCQSRSTQCGRELARSRKVSIKADSREFARGAAMSRSRQFSLPWHNTCEAGALRATTEHLHRLCLLPRSICIVRSRCQYSARKGLGTRRQPHNSWSRPMQTLGRCCERAAALFTHCIAMRESFAGFRLLPIVPSCLLLSS